MTVEIKEVELAEGQTPEVPESKELSIDEIKAQAKAEVELKYKELLSSRDKANTDMKKELLATKSAEEQAKFKADEERKEWLADIAKTKAEALQLDDKHSLLIKGSNKDEISQSAEMVKSLIESVSKEKDKTIKALEDKIKILEANGTPPASGQPTAGGARQQLINQYNDAEKRGDGAAMFSIKEQIQKLPKE